MRAVVQRVSEAEVSVGGETVAAIGAGLLVLVGVAEGDGAEQADRLAAKIGRLRIFEDEDGRTGAPLGDREVLCVSQFTLLGDVRKGNRPSFTAAADPAVAEPLYERICEALGARRGRFGERMAVRSVNDGPFTLLVEVTADER